MMIANNIEIKDKAVMDNLKRLTNQIYKLLPNREEGLDWQSPLTTIIIEFSGMNKLFQNNHTVLFMLLCKLEGLLDLTKEEDFYLYRKTIFECLGLIQVLKENLFEKEV